MISNETIVRAALAMIGVAFGAGAASFQMRRAARDLNGLGRKYHRLVGLLVRWSAGDEEKTKQLADLIEGK